MKEEGAETARKVLSAISIPRKNANSDTTHACVNASLTLSKPTWSTLTIPSLVREIHRPDTSTTHRPTNLEKSMRIGGETDEMLQREGSQYKREKMLGEANVSLTTMKVCANEREGFGINHPSLLVLHHFYEMKRDDTRWGSSTTVCVPTIPPCVLFSSYPSPTHPKLLQVSTFLSPHPLGQSCGVDPSDGRITVLSFAFNLFFSSNNLNGPCPVDSFSKTRSLRSGREGLSHPNYQSNLRTMVMAHGHNSFVAAILDLCKSVGGAKGRKSKGIASNAWP